MKRLLLLGLIVAASALTAGYWIPVKAEVAQRLLDRAWQQTLAGTTHAKPWPWADTSPVARLTIPSLEASWIVLSGASGRNLAFAPSLMDGSAAPGEPGVSLIAGHRDTHFEVLGHLQAGAALVVEDANGDVFRYRVFNIEIVDATKTSLRLDADRSLLVLATCYPFDALTAGGPLRFVVSAEAVSEGNKP